MPITLTSDETTSVTQGLQDLIGGMQKQMDQLNKEPSSDPKTKVVNALNAKMALAKQGLGLMTPAGAAAGAFQVPDLLMDIIMKLKDNTAPGGPLDAILNLLVDVLFNILDLVISLIETFVKKCVAIYEKHAGTAKALKDGTAYKLSGSTDSLRLQFSPGLVKQGLPSEAGPYSGTWTAGLIPDGTNAAGATQYRVTQYLCSLGNFVLGPIKLDGVEQVLDVEKISVFTVGADGKVTGTLCTRFKSTTWGETYPGIPGRTMITGTVSGDELTYEAEGWDFAWAAQLITSLQQPAATGPLVLHTDGSLAPFESDHLVGNLVRSNVPLATAEAVNSAVEKALPASGVVRTSTLNQVANLAKTNPFDEKVRQIMGAPAEALSAKPG